MAEQFIVLLDRGPLPAAAWGPFDTKPEAQRFADFVTAEVDPAEVRALISPVRELLAWRDMVKGEGRA